MRQESSDRCHLQHIDLLLIIRKVSNSTIDNGQQQKRVLTSEASPVKLLLRSPTLPPPTGTGEATAPPGTLGSGIDCAGDSKSNALEILALTGDTKASGWAGDGPRAVLTGACAGCAGAFCPGGIGAPATGGMTGAFTKKDLSGAGSTGGRGRPFLL